MAKTEDNATAALEAALAQSGFADPRPALRERLRVLRDTDPAAFERALARFQDVAREAATPADALESWIEYGGHLGELTGQGRLFGIDATGRGAPYSPPITSGTMVLHLPDDVGAPALGVLVPHDPSSAQQATYDLLVGKRLALTAG